MSLCDPITRKRAAKWADKVFAVVGVVPAGRARPVVRVPADGGFGS